MDWYQEQREGHQPEQVRCVELHWTFDAATYTAGIRVRPTDQGEIGAYEDTDPMIAWQRVTR